MLTHPSHRLHRHALKFTDADLRAVREHVKAAQAELEGETTTA